MKQFGTFLDSSTMNVGKSEVVTLQAWVTYSICSLEVFILLV